ncbi:MAG: hypothetical protein ICV64_01555 [Thermoleophilia bacterium]|nr:hypothetical protein [Thermoleophilia bacterium]
MTGETRRARRYAADGSSSRRLTRRGAAPDWQPVCTRPGTARGDRLRAGSGRDLVCGGAGADVLHGGPGADRLLAGPGDDRVDARGGGSDVVGCGPGRDAVLADADDFVGVDCERVERR